MFNRNRFSKFNQDNETYTCAECLYGTSRKANFERHLRSSRHKVLDQDLHGITEHDSDSGSESYHGDIDSSVRTVLTDVQCPENTTCDAYEFEDNSDVEDYPSVELDSEEDEEEPHENQQQRDNCFGSEWFPFESKIHFLLSVLYSSKTHRVSDEVMTFLIFILKECGIRDVPPLGRIKNYLQKKTGMEDMVQKHEDKAGNISFYIKPTAMLQLQMANPKVSKSLSRYPTIETTEQSNLQASGSKWKSIDFHWARNRIGHEFWRGNFVSFSVRGQCVFGKLRHFLENLQEEKIYVKVLLFLNNSHRSLTDFHVEDNCFVKMNKSYTVALDNCSSYDVSHISSMKEVLNGELVDVDIEDAEEILNSVSPLMKGIPIVSVPLNIFIDDLSANQSRRWAPIHSVQAQISGLPVAEKNRGRNVMFLGLSETMGMIDLLSPICQDINQCSKHYVYIDNNSTLTRHNNNIWMRLRNRQTRGSPAKDISLLVTDYQMMSMACNHLGPSANKFCPKCHADDSDPFKIFDLRTKESTCSTLERLALVRDKVSLQKQTGVKLFENCLWDYIDSHRETPLGMLHFLYLGLAKQLIKFCLQTLTDNQKELLAKHLDSIDQSGFSYQVNSSLFRYIDSRQGKDYKHYLQLAVINMDFAGLNRKYLHCLGKLAMISKHVLEENQVQLIGQEIQDYLIFLKDNIPDLGKKRKTHLCVHLADDMKRHGHPLHYTEDGFEKNHKYIRSSIAHQNGHARSRDTAIQFANNELMAHVISGGFIADGEEWKSGSSKVIAFSNNKKVLNFLGMPDKIDGQVDSKLRSVIKKQLTDDDFNSLELQILQALLNNGGSPHLLQNRKDLIVREYKTGTIQSGETARLDNFVLYMDEERKDHIGQIFKFLQISWKSQSFSIALLKTVELKGISNNDNCQRISPQQNQVVINIECLKHLIHVVHDCKHAKCHLKEGEREKKVEQEIKLVKSVFVKHNFNNNLYIINKFRLTHSFDKF